MINVFGINMPLFEIVLVFMILLVVGLIFVIIELKKLNYFLRVEKQDINRFEKDVETIEQVEKTENKQTNNYMEKNINNPVTANTNETEIPRF